MPKTYVVVNRHRVALNRKVRAGVLNREQVPVIRVSRGRHGKPRYTDHVLVGGGDVVLKYDPDNPMPCGATVWLETYGEVFT